MEHIPPMAIGAAVWLILILISAAFYFLPAIIAFYSKHPKRWLIFVLTLFFGWSIIGWILLIVWACRPRAGTGHNGVVLIEGDKTIIYNENNF